MNGRERGVDVERAAELFRAACELPVEERAAWLAEACAGDEALRARVAALLETDADGAADLPTAGGAAWLDPPAAAAVPDRVGPYEILATLGEGGMGVVYRARQDAPQREVALKLIQPWALSERSLRRFEHEVELLGRLQHPGIAQIHAAGTADTPLGRQPYFAMELVEGRPLLEDVQTRGLSTRQRLELFAGICEAVHHAHQKGVIHRDLKPGNVLVDTEGRPRVLDFGVARATDGDLQALTRATGVGQIIGTLAYMSPEQAAGDPDGIDTRTDVYSLGVILYELLTGRLPYPVREKPLHEAVRILREEDPTPPSSAVRVLRGDVETIVLRALEKQKERRYASAHELAADVRRFLADEPILARPPSASYQARKFARRHKAIVGAAVGVVAALMIGLALAAGALRKERAARREARERLEDFVRLADVKRLADLRSEADELWPAHPRRIAAIESWLGRSRELGERLFVHRASLEELRASTSGPAVAEQELVFERDEDSWMHEQLEGLVAGIVDLSDPSGGLGSLAEMEQRLERARTIRGRSVDGHAQAWAEALAALAADGRFGDLDLEPQIGLVPVGTDPVTGLWEFWHVESGERPVRDPASGRLAVEGDSGVVLVLLPGGSFTMGSQADDPGGPCHDPWAKIDESVHSVTLGPFFLSKYELTQGQWSRLTGSNPSWSQADVLGEAAAGHPVEMVSWLDCHDVLRRVGLTLPTEAQWEFAARARTQTVWWCGSTPATLVGVANVADASYKRAYETVAEWNDELDDGHALHAPVGTFAPNAFGVHEVVGNVWEWCRDSYETYDLPTDRTDGLRLIASSEQSPFRTYRGGSFSSPWPLSRTANRLKVEADFRELDIGLRPSRAIER